jgi:hypothetical protein
VNALLSEYLWTPLSPVSWYLKRETSMNDAKLQIPRTPLSAGEKISTHSVSLTAAPADRDLRSRHSAITADLYSYHRYKMWTAKARDAFEEAK